MIFERLGHFVLKHRRAVIVPWAIITIVCSVVVPQGSTSEVNVKYRYLSDEANLNHLKGRLS